MRTPHPWLGIRPWQRHSLVLMVAGLVYVLIGLSYILTDPTPARTIALKYALTLACADIWGWVFIFSGILSIVSARWPPISETWGYTVLTGLSAAWAAFYLMGIVFGHSPLANVSGVFSWGLIAFMWWAISGLLNPPPKRGMIVVRDEGD